MILRLYGTADTIHPRDPDWDAMTGLFPAFTGARQVYRLHIDLVQTSCGFAVPFYEFAGERDTLNNWADKRGPDGIRDYWAEKNQQSIDGAPTHILDRSGQ